jgi:hypothetical protein
MQVEAGIQVDEIGRSDQARFTEISPLREQGIEGLQVCVVRVFIATGDIRPQAEAQAISAGLRSIMAFHIRRAPS